MGWRQLLIHIHWFTDTGSLVYDSSVFTNYLPIISKESLAFS